MHHVLVFLLIAKRLLIKKDKLHKMSAYWQYIGSQVQPNQNSCNAR